ncbi:MAG: hypothetical protein ABIN94_17785 [Ferruginibacter sp.]
MLKLLATFCICVLLFSSPSNAQNADSTIEALQQIPAKYIKSIDHKITQYSSRVSGKTEKTLARLSRWEGKIQGLLQQANPQAAERLFGNSQLTFTTLLHKLQAGKDLTLQYQGQYNQYLDKLTTNIKYLQQQKENVAQKLVQPLQSAEKKVKEINEEEDKTEAIQQFIKERKKQLIDGAIQFIGKNKYLKKINKEAYYYIETIKNYRAILSDQDKTEEAVKNILNKIPAFQKFAADNSSLTRLFSSTGSFPSLPTTSSIPVVNGLSPRNLVQNFIQVSLPGSSMPNPLQKLQSPESKPLLDKIKNAVVAKGDERLPEIKPNTQKTQPFKKRLEWGTDVQFGKSNNYLPATASIALKLGYKMNDKSSAGVGINYIAGLGQGWRNIRFTSNGIGLRSYLKWKLKKGLDLQGGSEWNYLSFYNLNELKNKDQWQQSALLGLCKSYTISKKVKGNLQVLYDFIYNRHIPVSQPFVFRVGYGL